MLKAELINEIAKQIASAMFECIEDDKELTNGEVMKAVFPKISVFENIDVLYSYVDVFNPDERDMPMHTYNKAWWNSPYKAESMEE